jgi:hypothetical protein
MIEDLLKAIEESDAATAGELFQEMARKAENVSQIHLSLYPVVQQVMNPPFINPHLPKIYSIYRELTPYLKQDEIPAFVQLEITEYARRPKLERLPRATLPGPPVSFRDIEMAIRKQDPKQAAERMYGFCSQQGTTEFARRLLLLGSGYLEHSLGHSISCTVFILLEMLRRPQQDFWPALATLADYFCKGGFHTTPGLRKLTLFPLDEAIKHHLLRATSGLGIVNLHHTITLYAMERARHFFDKDEYAHMIDAWISFMGDKKAELFNVGGTNGKPITHYDPFYEVFAGMEAKPLVALAGRMVTSPESRQNLGRFLIKGLCDKYNGDYNPHYLTGLGSVLWVVDRYWSQTSLAMNALFQYLRFYFDNMRSGN